MTTSVLSISPASNLLTALAQILPSDISKSRTLESYRIPNTDRVIGAGSDIETCFASFEHKEEVPGRADDRLLD